MQTRLKKLEDSNWNGALFAAAGLERLELDIASKTLLKWMIPAPAQGAIAVVVSSSDKNIKEVVARLNHTDTKTCTGVERDFLRSLEGGCSAPIGALAKIEGDRLIFKGVLLSPDGQKRIHIAREDHVSNAAELGTCYAQEVLARGGDEIMKEIKEHLSK